MDEQYIMWDYKDGWVGVRVEPKDERRAKAMNEAIPAADRIYLRPKRLWAFRPEHTGKVLEILAHFCPGFPVYLEPEHQELLTVLLKGASQGMVQLPLVLPPRPEGVHVGTLDDLLRRW